MLQLHVDCAKSCKLLVQ